MRNHDSVGELGGGGCSSSYCPNPTRGCALLRNAGPHAFIEGGLRKAVGDHEAINALFPHLCQPGLRRMVHFVGTTEGGEPVPRGPLRIGVVLSGGQAAGGHNVIVGVHDYLQRFNPESQLFGFLDGPRGILTGNARELHAQELAFYRNQVGGWVGCWGRVGG